MFHSHGFQEEHGNMDTIVVKDNTTKMTNSVSMFDWQYKIQNELQRGETTERRNYRKVI
jgi:hypothetical protein